MRIQHRVFIAKFREFSLQSIWTDWCASIHWHFFEQRRLSQQQGPLQRYILQYLADSLGGQTRVDWDIGATSFQYSQKRHNRINAPFHEDRHQSSSLHTVFKQVPGQTVGGLVQLHEADFHIFESNSHPTRMQTNSLLEELVDTAIFRKSCPGLIPTLKQQLPFLLRDYGYLTKTAIRCRAKLLQRKNQLLKEAGCPRRIDAISLVHRY
jgi:hypothetical protein